MNDEQDSPIAEEPQDSGPRGGERLAHARRERQISVLEVAKELHLDEPKVRALERNDFDVLGAPVFAKGHLRKYAQLVGVDEADVLADYYAMTRTSAMPPVVVGRTRIQQEFSPGPWIAVIAVLSVAAGAYWWFVERDPELRVTPVPQDVVEPEQAPPAQFRPEPVQPEVLEQEQPQPQQSEPEPAQSALRQPAEIVPAAVAEPAAADAQVSLSMAFSGECWTEIIDADGRRLFINMGNAGQSVSVRGRAPISALFGNVANVQVQVDGDDYALPVARNANGTVRVSIAKR